MIMLVIIGILFVGAAVCPFILPNEKVSNHERDWDAW